MIDERGAYLLRPPEARDVPRLRELAKLVWPTADPDKLIYRWWWRTHEGPHCIISEHLETGEIAAILGTRRIRFAMNGEEFPAISICDWAVSPRHGGKGVARSLVRAAEENIRVLYGTTACQAAVDGLTKLGWGNDTRLPVHVTAALPASIVCSRAPKEVEVRSLKVSGEAAADLSEIDDLWSSSQPADYIGIVRDGAFLKNHLLFSPRRTYELQIAYVGGSARGYCLHRVLPRRSFRRMRWIRFGFVVDLYVDEEVPGVGEALLGAACRSFTASGVTVVAALATRPLYLQALSRAGFVSSRSAPFRKLLAPVNTRMISYPAGTPEFSRGWHVTFVDNDMDLLFGSARDQRDEPTVGATVGP